MTSIIIATLYSIWIIIATYVLIAFRRELDRYKWFLLAAIWAFALWKWIFLRLPELQVFVWVTFGDILILSILTFLFVVPSYFVLLEKKYDDNKELEISEKDKRNMFLIYLLIILLHTLPEAVMIWYKYIFLANENLIIIIRDLLEELPEYVLLLSLFLIYTKDKAKTLILWIMTSLLFPIVTLLLYVFVMENNPSVSLFLKNFLLWFYLLVWVFAFNIILKYNKKYIYVFMLILWFFWIIRYFVWY